MSRKCDISGKSKQKGHNVSHAQNKTNRHWKPNLRKVKVLVAGVAKTLTVSMSVYKKLKKGEIKDVKLNYSRPVAKN